MRVNPICTRRSLSFASGSHTHERTRPSVHVEQRQEDATVHIGER